MIPFPHKFAAYQFDARVEYRRRLREAISPELTGSWAWGRTSDGGFFLALGEPAEEFGVATLRHQVTVRGRRLRTLDLRPIDWLVIDQGAGILHVQSVHFLYTGTFTPGEHLCPYADNMPDASSCPSVVFSGPILTCGTAYEELGLIRRTLASKEPSITLSSLEFVP